MGFVVRAVLILCVLVITAPLPAENFSDNFDFYTPGDDLESSPFWSKPDSCGNLVVTDTGGNMVVETVWNGFPSLAYACLGSGVVTDCILEADVNYTGLETSCGLLARVNDTTGEGYIGYIYSALPDIGVTFIAYVDGNGNYTTLDSDYYYPFNAGDWYTLSFQVIGIDPVELTVSVNGTESTSVQDSVYNLSAGLTGIGSSCSGSSSVFSVDNYSVIDNASDLAAVTFGEIKTLFR